MSKISTINVVENFGGVMGQIHAFSSDDAGKQLAEEMFSRIVREQATQANEFEEPDDIEQIIEDALMDGIYEHDDYELLIKWSVID
jgi:hypothetical protein